MEAARHVASQLAGIGLRVRVDVQDPGTFYSTYRDPKAHAAMRVDSWIKDLVSGAVYFPFLFGGPPTGVTDGYGGELLGAPPSLLRAWGYKVTSVPNVDDRIERCLSLTFGAQIRCWAQLDQYLMADVVPWIPLVGFLSGRVVSDRLTRFRFDQAWALPLPALDQIAVKPGSVASPTPQSSPDIPPIPPGRYQVTITKADLYRFDPNVDPGGIDEYTGTVTITLRPDGWFESWARADHTISHPISVGIYEGSGDTVTFKTVAFAGNILTTPPMRWSLEGTSLRFAFLSCAGLHDPENPGFCNDIRVLYEAHPWVRIG